MVTPEETAKAEQRALAQGVRVWELEAGKRHVALSCSQDGRAYEIIIHSPAPGDISCGCKGYEYHRHCKHIGKVMLRLKAAQPQANDQLERDIQDLYYR
jgi:hypothetical protein